MNSKTIAFPHLPASGGPGSFQTRFEHELKKAGWKISYAGPDTRRPDIVLVVGGTRKLFWLLKMKILKVPIVYRLDGILWLHRKRKVSIAQFIKSEFQNFIFKVIRTFLADVIIYQSEFVKKWWEIKGWKTKAEAYVIYNGVDPNVFKPKQTNKLNREIMCLEGNIDYSPFAIELLNKLSERLPDNHSLVVYGGMEQKENIKLLGSKIDYRGRIERNIVHTAYKSDVYLSLDVNAACPNTVIEALASGIPVVGFDTGALKEIVAPGAGEIVDFGTNPWELHLPSIDNLLAGIQKIFDCRQQYSKNARKLAEDKFDISKMFKAYEKIIWKELYRDGT